jgi:AcrR family transcriptional regulator
VLSIVASALEIGDDQTVTTGSPITARARARAMLTDDIKAAARRQVQAHGAAALSLRAVARELGMVSSAIYRYFGSRDELLTALIIDAFDAVGAAAEAAVANRRGTVRERWLRLARAVRSWALEHPHDYALVYGSPVPGYRAPEATVPPATRVSVVGLDLVRDAYERGELAVRDVPIPRAVATDLGAMRSLAPGVPDEILSRALLAWTQLFGTISFELFGHLHNVVTDYDAFFDLQMGRAGDLLTTGV